MNNLVRCKHERNSPSVFWESAVNCIIYTCFIWMGFCRVLDVKHDYILRWSSIQFQSNHRVCTSVSLSPQQLLSFEKYDYLHDVYQYHFILDYWIYYQNIAAFTWSRSIYCSFLSSFITSLTGSRIPANAQFRSGSDECVDLSQRCDNVFEWIDHNDEKNSGKILKIKTNWKNNRLNGWTYWACVVLHLMAHQGR